MRVDRIGHPIATRAPRAVELGLTRADPGAWQEKIRKFYPNAK